jgi:SAM-dependent methyltransferase
MTNRASKRLSPSVAKGLSMRRKVSEGVQLFREHRETARAGHNFDALFRDIEEYDALLNKYAGLRLRNAQTLEIGFGARPYRQMILHSEGVDTIGVDAEMPVLNGHPAEFASMLKRNGVERAAKSLLRHTFFDRGERQALRCAISQRGLAPRLDPSRLIVSDAAEIDISPSSLDLVFSEDVFEHIEYATLQRLVPRIAEWLRPGGLALIRPNVFPGIVGGHLVEWSRVSMQRPSARRTSEPWEHLRKRRFQPNTYLNELTRVQYRQLFDSRFDILEERVADPDLGREFFDDRAQHELADWPDEELFSNQTLFVLRLRKSGNHSQSGSTP